MRTRQTAWAVAAAVAAMVAALTIASCSDDATTTDVGTEAPTSAVAEQTSPSTRPAATVPQDSSVTTVPDASPISVDSDGTSQVPHQRMQDGIDSLPVSDLSVAEQADLVYMREEERLAQNVNEVMFTLWNRTIFTNVAASEATHTDAIMLLLERYGLADPAVGAGPATFADPALQDLYDRFISDGKVSVTGAMAAGAAIEERDIADLRSRASEAPDIDLVYSNLEQASRNHLRVFVGELDKLGVSYAPEFLPQDEYEAIISTPIERG